MAKIDVRCPVCSEWKNIEIPDDVTKNSKKGLLTINITSGMICEHSFIVYLDKNLVVRDCFVADFKIEVPDESITQADKNGADTFKIDLIKLNMPKLLIAYILKSIFYKKKVLIISDQEFLFDHITNFFNYVMQNSFEVDITAITNEQYKKNKKRYKEHLIFMGRDIVRDKKGLINPKKLEIEKNIVDKFLAENDAKAALIILRNEINKAFEFSKIITSYVKDSKGTVLTSKKILNHLTKECNEKITMVYLNFLKEIVKYYFEADIPKIDGATNLLGSL